MTVDTIAQQSEKLGVVLYLCLGSGLRNCWAQWPYIVLGDWSVHLEPSRAMNVVWLLENYKLVWNMSMNRHSFAIWMNLHKNCVPSLSVCLQECRYECCRNAGVSVLSLSLWRHAVHTQHTHPHTANWGAGCSLKDIQWIITGHKSLKNGSKSNKWGSLNKFRKFWTN